VTGPSFDERRLSFGEQAARYDAYRPEYAPRAVDWVLEGASRPVHDVADIGAGTGKLTRALAARGLSVTAVEPDPEMLAALLAGAPGVRGENAPAEHLPLGDASVDALFVGQAWHWFDAGPTAREFRRVLRPGGVVGILWNDRDDAAAPWLGELRTLLEDHFVAEYTSDESARSLEEVFPGVEADLFANTLVLGPDAVIGLVSTYSYVRLRDDADEVIRLARVLLPDPVEVDGRLVIEIPHRTATYRWTRP
jgi:SAM-dependent methyltransferase